MRFPYARAPYRYEEAVITLTDAMPVKEVLLETSFVGELGGTEVTMVMPVARMRQEVTLQVSPTLECTVALITSILPFQAVPLALGFAGRIWYG